MFSAIKNSLFGSTKWKECCEALKNDFGYEITTSPNATMVKKLWNELNDEHQLSLNSSIALFYRIYFLSFLAAYKMMKEDNEADLDITLIEDLLPLLNKSIEYAIRSIDYKKLEYASSHLNKSIEKMLNEIGIEWPVNEYQNKEEKEVEKIYKWIRTEDGLIDMNNPNTLIFDSQIKKKVQPEREGLLYNNFKKEIFIPAEEIKDFWKYC